MMMKIRVRWSSVKKKLQNYNVAFIKIKVAATGKIQAYSLQIQYIWNKNCSHHNWSYLHTDDIISISNALTITVHSNLPRSRKSRKIWRLPTSVARTIWLDSGHISWRYSGRMWFLIRTVSSLWYKASPSQQILPCDVILVLCVYKCLCWNNVEKILSTIYVYCKT